MKKNGNLCYFFDFTYTKNNEKYLTVFCFNINSTPNINILKIKKVFRYEFDVNILFSIICIFCFFVNPVIPLSFMKFLYNINCLLLCEWSSDECESYKFSF